MDFLLLKKNAVLLKTGGSRIVLLYMNNNYSACLGLTKLPQTSIQQNPFKAY
jgi:hypothetical protein